MCKTRQRLKDLRKRTILFVIPPSRCDSLGINCNEAWNKVVVTARQCRFYIQLFSGKTPQEILDFLVSEFWNGFIDPPTDPIQEAEHLLRPANIRRYTGNLCDYNEHHVFPRSRCAELGIKANADWNRIYVRRSEHLVYHRLFYNKIPREICEFLQTNFWRSILDPPQIRLKGA